MSVNYVKFQRGTQSAYDTLKAQGRLDSNTLYFIRPDNGAQFGALYMGESIISGGDVVVESGSLSDLSDVVLTGAGANYFLVRDEEGKWIATNPETVASLILSYANIPAGDNLSIEIVDNNIQLHDFGSKYYKYIPAVKDENGEVITESSYQEVEGFKEGLELHVISNADGKHEIAWYEPSNENIEDIVNDKIGNIQNKVDELNQEIETISNEIGKAADESNAATGLHKVIEDAVSAEEIRAKAAEETNAEAIANEIARAEAAEQANAEAIANEQSRAEAVEKGLQDAINVLNGSAETEGSVAKKIADAIANVDHLKREIFADLDAAEEAVKNYGDSAGQYIYMVARAGDEDGNHYDEYMAFKLSEDSDMWLLERVGDWGIDLSEYAKIADVNAELAKKVDVVEGARLITDVEVKKLSSIEEGAQINYISAVDIEFVVSEGKLSLNNIDISKVSELQNILAEKVDKVYYTVENEDGSTSKVEGTLLSPEDKEKLNALVIDEDGSVGISGTVNASNVEGLGNWITDNGVTYISGLTENNLSTTLAEKINFITSVDTDTFKVTEGKLELVNVPVEALYSTVGDLTKIQNYVVGNTLVDEINSIYDILTWTEMV